MNFQRSPFQCIFNDFGFPLDIDMKINLHIWFYFIVSFKILDITTGHMESSVLLSLSASCSLNVLMHFVMLM